MRLHCEMTVSVRCARVMLPMFRRLLELGLVLCGGRVYLLWQGAVLSFLVNTYARHTFTIAHRGGQQ